MTTINCTHSPVTKGMQAVVVGTGASGQAAANLLHALGARVRIVDRDAARVPEAFRKVIKDNGYETVFGPHTAVQFAGADIVVPSPGVAVAKLAPFISANTRIMAEMELAWHCVSYIPVLAVTGTNGKTTTVRLCAAMLEQAGKKVFLGGNIGTPLSEFVLNGDEADILVLEVSSFQLQTCHALKPKVAMLLNISEDHLDYHADMKEYADAKMRLFANQESDDYAFFGESVAELTDKYAVHSTVQVLHETERFPMAALKGHHNRLNMEAAYQACSVFGVTEEQAAKAVEGVTAAPHTLEPVCESEGILFVNDSKATTIESVKAALESFDRPILLLAGGVYKGGDVSSLLPLMRERVKAVGLYGSSREIFEPVWAQVVDVTWSETMEEAARKLHSIAEEGDVILLSPATSSFDQFANYKARGEEFARIAEALS